MLSAAVGPALAADEAPNPWFDLSWVVHNWSTIMPLLGQHVRMTVISVLVGAAIALPLALLARSSRLLSVDLQFSA